MVSTCRGASSARFLQSRAKLEQRRMGDARDLVVAAITGATVSLVSVCQRAAFLEQHPEVERTGRIAALIRATICRLGRSRRTPLLEEHTEI